MKTKLEKIKNILTLMRIHHWVKNTFLFIPAFFGSDLLDEKSLINLIIGFFLFSIISSSIYIINDFKDIELDKRHPSKQNRPLASGEISKILGLILFAILVVTGFTAAYLLLNKYFILILFIYFLNNIFYSFGGKNIPILELFIVSSGFLLRVLAGSFISGTMISEWLIIMVFLLALFITLNKRRTDLVVFEKSGQIRRKSIIHYNIIYIDSLLSLLSSTIIVVYIMYTLSSEVIERLGNKYIYGTTIFVAAGLFRYLKISLVDEKDDSPVKTFYNDKFIIINILLWIGSFYYFIYW